MSWIRNASQAVIIAIIATCGAGAIATLGGFIALELAGRSTDDYLSFILMIINAVALLAGGTVTAVRASTKR